MLLFLIRVVVYRVRFGSRSFFFQAEDGIRDLVRSRGLGDVYKRQVSISSLSFFKSSSDISVFIFAIQIPSGDFVKFQDLSLIHI